MNEERAVYLKGFRAKAINVRDCIMLEPCLCCYGMIRGSGDEGKESRSIGGALVEYRPDSTLHREGHWSLRCSRPTASGTPVRLL